MLSARKARQETQIRHIMKIIWPDLNVGQDDIFTKKQPCYKLMTCNEKVSNGNFGCTSISYFVSYVVRLQVRGAGKTVLSASTSICTPSRQVSSLLTRHSKLRGCHVLCVIALQSVVPWPCVLQVASLRSYHLNPWNWLLKGPPSRFVSPPPALWRKLCGIKRTQAACRTWPQVPLVHGSPRNFSHGTALPTWYWNPSE